MGSGSWELSAGERRAYAEDGFFIRLRSFGDAEVAALCAAAEQAVERASAAAAGGGAAQYEIDGNLYCEATGTTVQFEHRTGSRTIRVLEPFHHLDPLFESLIDDPRLVEPMRGLVGSSRIALFTDKLNLKRPREGSRFRWHQDSPYWAHCCPHVDRLPNVMLSLDDASERNGCLRVVRGSHTRGMLPGLEGEGRLGPLFTDPHGFDLSQQVPAEMPAGSLLFFSPHIVHGSEPNLSDAARRAMVLTYQPGGHPMFKVDAKREAG
ncbi:MAG: phytanoyl-CoA dioxygenase family protein [Myxococcales bacterium]|nr:phytanoyl-CoA dioxygenase family protein [Myxococcales bacterium]